MRRAARKDTTQPDIVTDLRKLGYYVEIKNDEHKPDLLVRHPAWVSNVWIRAETKTPNRAGGKFKPRSDQQEQADFCAEHSVPYWLCTQDALTYLKLYESRLIAPCHESR